MGEPRGAGPGDVPPGPGWPAQGVVRHVKGRPSGRGIPEAHELVIELADGKVIDAGAPEPAGEEMSARILGAPARFVGFNECPICLAADPRSREHVPPASIGGNVLTLTCEDCNNVFGTLFEPHLQAWYENSLGRVRISGGDIPGSRHAGEYLHRRTAQGEFVLVQTGRADPSVEQIMRSGEATMTYSPLNTRAMRIAAVKAAYLAACVIVGEVPNRPRANAVRAALAEARSRTRDDRSELSPALATIKIARSREVPAPGDIRLVQFTNNDGTVRHAISFNRVFAVDWPLDPITSAPSRVDSDSAE